MPDQGSRTAHTEYRKAIKSPKFMVYLKGGRFAMQTLKATKKGITWSSMADLNEFMDGLAGTESLKPIKMTTTI